MALAKGVVELNAKEEEALHRISENTQTFALKLFKELSKNNPGNLFVSPLSVQVVLALAYTGAKGDTAQEIADLLSLPEHIEDTYLGYKTLIEVLQNPSLKLANRMFMEATATIKEAFQAKAEQHFQAPAESVNFKEDPDKSRQHINAWVEDKTNKKITELLAQGLVDKDTRLILVNAIHFKSNWDFKFKEENTKEKPFYLSKSQTVPAQMMNAERKFYYTYSEVLNAKVLGLDYEGKDFQMLIILPDEKDGLAALESKLETVNLGTLMKQLERCKVAVSLPKFKLEDTMDLEQTLENLGAQSMFNPVKADFSGLSDESLVVSKVVQKAFVEVNEEGTEAAAATAFKMVLLCYQYPVQFIADHPFIFVISHSATSSVLFVGRFCSPDLENREN